MSEKYKVNFQNNKLKETQAIKERAGEWLKNKSFVLDNTDDAELTPQDFELKTHLKNIEEQNKQALENNDMFDWAERYHDRWADQAFQENDDRENINDDEWIIQKGEEFVKALAGRQDQKYSQEQLNEFLENLKMFVYKSPQTHDIEMMKNNPRRYNQQQIQKAEERNKKAAELQAKYKVLYEQTMKKRNMRGN